MWKFAIAVVCVGLVAQNGPPGPKAAPKKAPAQKCGPDGRYWFHLDKGQKVFCFDGDGYSEDVAPPHVKTFFETNGAGDGVSTTETLANPAMIDPSLPGNSGGGAMVSTGPVSGSGGAGGGGGGGGKSNIKEYGSMVPGGGAPPPRRDPVPVHPDLFEAVNKGMTRSAVTSKLGTPHGRIMNSGDEGVEEIWTYLAKGVGTGSVRFRDGRVVGVRKP